MPTGFFQTLFPSRRDDASRLRQSATDAVNDLSSSVHQTSDVLSNLAEQLGSESRVRLNRAAAQVAGLARATRELARERPLTCLATAVALGLALGWLSGLRGGSAPRRHGGRTPYDWSKR